MENQSNQYLEEDEIDLRELIIPIWKNKFKIIIIALITGIGTLAYNFTIDNYYTTSTKLLPEASSGSSMGGGGLSSLAGLAGINLNSMGSGGEAYRPDLYPEVLNSIEFKKELLNQNFYFSTLKKNLSLKEYLLQDSKLEINEKPLIFDKEEVIKNTKNLILSDLEESSLLKTISSKISTSLDKKSGIISINVTLTDPVGAAEITEFSKNYLSDFIQNYRTEKQKKELEYLDSQYKEAEVKYNAALKALSSFQDGNADIYSNAIKDRERRLNDELNIAYNLYSALSTQKAQAELQLEKANPVIQVLEPVVIPIVKAGPTKAINSIIGTFIGGILAAGFFLIKSFKVFDFFKTLN